MKRRALAVVQDYCANNCYGKKGNAGGCCKLQDRDFIIGPVTDAEALLQRLSKRFVRKVLRAEALVEYAEGSALFPERGHWQVRANYPAMRVRLDTADKACVFYSAHEGCLVYAGRPQVCQRYLCGPLHAELMQHAASEQ